MALIVPAPPSRYEAVLGTEVSPRLEVWGNAPEIAAAVDNVAKVANEHSVLPPRLVELVRLRVAFHNQCRTCMATRYSHAAEAGVDEDLVCSLERPEEAPDLTEAERVALAFADRFATDHLSVDAQMKERLREWFNDAQLMELCFRIAYWLGFGRMSAILDIRPDTLPERFRAEDAVMTPWGDGPLVRV